MSDQPTDQDRATVIRDSFRHNLYTEDEIVEAFLRPAPVPVVPQSAPPDALAPLRALVEQWRKHGITFGMCEAADQVEAALSACAPKESEK